MSRATLERALAVGSTIVLDSSTILAYLNGNEAASPAATVVFDDFVRPGRNPGLISAISLTEILVRPMRAGGTAAAVVEEFMEHFPNLTLRSVDLAVAREAARVRAVTSLKTPDAVIVATALVEGVRSIVANDDRWVAVPESAGMDLQVCYLEAHLPI